MTATKDIGLAEVTFCSDKEAETESKQPRFAVSFTARPSSRSTMSYYSLYKIKELDLGQEKSTCSATLIRKKPPQKAKESEERGGTHKRGD